MTLQPTQLTDDAAHLVEGVPATGPISNRQLRDDLNWTDDEDRYWRARDEALAAGLIERGRGRGGTVHRLDEGPIYTSDPAPDLTDDFKQPEYLRESHLYEPMREVIHHDWSKERGYDPIDTVKTAGQGRRQTGGAWTRPDIVTFSVKDYPHLPGKYLEVITFEIKPVDCITVQAVYEALAHRRAATRSYVLLHIPHDRAKALANEVEKIVATANPLKIGVIVAENPADFGTWINHVIADRTEPDPESLEKFIAVQLPHHAKRIAQLVT